MTVEDNNNKKIFISFDFIFSCRQSSHFGHSLNTKTEKEKEKKRQKQTLCTYSLRCSTPHGH